MCNNFLSRQQPNFPKYLLKWLIIILPVAAAIGGIVAFFLWLLDEAIHYRFEHPWLLYFLPLAGILIHLIYQGFGKSSERGNNLIIDEIFSPSGAVPARMGPLILFTTIITHLFGGSAGREGTAVQIGGSFCALVARWLKLTPEDISTLMSAGIAAGFGAVFGTPIAGAIFAMEVLRRGRIRLESWFPCLLASIIADYTVACVGVSHTLYPEVIKPKYAGMLSELVLGARVVVASICLGLASLFFIRLTKTIKSLFGRYIGLPWLIPAAGGLLIISISLILDKPDYLSLGVHPQYPEAVTLISAFKQDGATLLSWFWKSLFTAITLGSGFKGGEVTPLFYIGATLGNSLAELLSAPVSLFAALGFIAVFAGASNTPLACTVMGAELFGAEHLLFYALACYVAYLSSGSSSIYSAQRMTQDDPV